MKSKHKGCKIDRVRTKLKSEGFITVLEAKDMGVEHLRAHIHFLRRMGWVIGNTEPKRYELIQ